jgi:hypothetical protein
VFESGHGQTILFAIIMRIIIIGITIIGIRIKIGIRISMRIIIGGRITRII